ncbi:MAG: nitronate monooxygenase [Anaerolineae bacterium]|nr:nitronate monooxygenase [Anaerolineae bacterium]MCX8067980.1 nitronate monooxygenase [Anaerolineae bacterium]MDW7992000.1 nitronate monooxygenase [Anaerolineae bacterium]
MLKTRVTELFGIRYPIVGGCMMHISGPEFVAAISNAGALGVLASAMYTDRESFREAIRKTRALTDQPFAVNLSLHPAIRPIDNHVYVDVILEEGVSIVETSGHRPPEDLYARLKGGGVKVMHKCVSVRHAQTAQRLGADAVTVFGYEGGGHIGELGLTTMVLVPLAADALSVPVLAAGGIADGRGLAAALALGAEGVVVGTRLLLTQECPIHPAVKEALVAATELETRPILHTLQNTMRAWDNAAARRVAELEARGASLPEILAVVGGHMTRRMFETGETDVGVMACSQAVGLVREVRPVAEVIQEMVAQAREVLLRLAAD